MRLYYRFTKYVLNIRLELETLFSNNYCTSWDFGVSDAIRNGRFCRLWLSYSQSEILDSINRIRQLPQETLRVDFVQSTVLRVYSSFYCAGVLSLLSVL